MQTYVVSLSLYDGLGQELWKREIKTHAPFTAMSDLFFQVSEETEILPEQVARMEPQIKKGENR